LKIGKKGKDLAEVREREWVLPSHIREKWSLRRFAECFDGVGEVPERGERVGEIGADGNEKRHEREAASGGTEATEDQRENTRRGGKRMLLATVCDDSTVVYYIVHDGIVKPRQN
jgi:tRNA-splicing endonuclease subunit Sen15